MKIKHWNGAKLEDVSVQDLPNFAREGLYVENADGTRHLWIYSGPDPVPSGAQIKQKIEKEVPH
jgi:hypothetical protein